jgi:heme/copper-type cytochrome/quinol oxidase subunit 2
MNTSALILMILTVGLVVGITIYFFVKVLRTPPNPEPDSYSQNDEVLKRQQDENSRNGTN